MNALPHVILADEVRQELQWPDWVRIHAIIGGIAPDAHRLLPGVSFRSLHFRSRRKIGERLRDFLGEYLRPVLQAGGNDEQAYWIGWLSHVVGDTIWQRMLRTELAEFWASCTGPDHAHAMAMRAEYQCACDRVDNEIAAGQPEYFSELRWMLRSANPTYDLYPLNPVVLNEWIGKVATDALPPTPPSSPGTNLVTLDFVRRAIALAREETVAIATREMEVARQTASDMIGDLE
jgi:hypothetical protein